jgi:uncharacterized protein YdaU (DUF1376 family)
MPFHIDRWRGSAHVQAMRAAARAGYLYLLASAWQSEDCSLTDEDEELQVLAGLTEEEWAQHGAKILRRFTRREDGRYVNDVLQAEWTAAKLVYDKRSNSFEQVRRSRSAAGKMGAEKRWNRSAGGGDAAVNNGETAVNSGETAINSGDRAIPRGETAIAGGDSAITEVSSIDGSAMANGICGDGNAMANGTRGDGGWMAKDGLQGQEQQQEQRRAEAQDSTIHAVSDAPRFLELPLLGRQTHVLTEEDVAAYQAAYAAVDVRTELRKLLPWLDANPAKQSRTVAGSKRRIVSWLARAQDRVQDRIQNRIHDAAQERGASHGSNQHGGYGVRQPGGGGGRFASRSVPSRGQQRVEQALEELARAGVRVAVERPEAGVGEVWAAAGRGDGRDAAGVVLQGYC